MPRLTSYTGKTALITGASSGIGRLLALRLARAGARVVLVARRDDALRAVAAEIAAAGGTAVVLPCDVADRDQVSAAAAQAVRQCGTIDILVNNAGYGHHRRFVDWDIDDIERMTRVNYLGSVYWTKALLPHMVERRSGWLVFVASVAGKIGVQIRPGRPGGSAVHRTRGRRRARAHGMSGDDQHAVLRRRGARAHAAGVEADDD